MSDSFVFFAQLEPMKMNEELTKMNKEPMKMNEESSNCKKARAEDEAVMEVHRRSGSESFKLKLLNSVNPGSWTRFGSGKEKLKINQRDIVVVESPSSPTMKLSSKLKQHLCKPWMNALILKIMEIPYTLNFTLQKLCQKWNLSSQWQLTDLEGGFFVARLQMHADVDYVLTGGPWIIGSQYLVVQKWRPNFVPGEEPIRKMMVWVRISKLPIKWIDGELLWNIGGMLGITLKVDLVTEAQSRGRFARICIEINISEPLKSSLLIEDRAVKIEYENLGLICFSCEKVEHAKEMFKEGVMEHETIDEATGNIGSDKGSKDNPCGPWMMVSYRRKGRSGGYKSRRVNQGRNMKARNGSLRGMNGFEINRTGNFGSGGDGIKAVFDKYNKKVAASVIVGRGKVDNA
ncbi:hypothetical protein ACOSQ4_014231 [Xanthoceras sorbifolium]